MATTVLVSTLIDQVRALVDREEDDFLTDPFIMKELSKANGHVWARLVDKFEHYGVHTTTFSTVVDTEVYDLPDNFLKSVMVHQRDGTDWVPCDRYTDGERHHYENSNDSHFSYQVVASGISLLPQPTSVETIRLKYVHTATPFTSTSQTVTFADPMQEDLIVLMGAKRCMIRQNLPATNFNDEIDTLTKLLEEAADTRDAGKPHKISDTYKPRG